MERDAGTGQSRERFIALPIKTTSPPTVKNREEKRRTRLWSDAVARPIDVPPTWIHAHLSLAMMEAREETLAGSAERTIQRLLEPA